jgi:DNA-binding FadR family transcriptional regulator
MLQGIKHPLLPLNLLFIRKFFLSFVAASVVNKGLSARQIGIIWFFTKPKLLTVNVSYRFRTTLFEQLQSGQWRAGERLPTEREFVIAHEISRSTVRKVLAEMKTLGLIAQTVGSGTYVTDKGAALAVAHTAAPGTHPEVIWQTSPAELMDARMALEPAIIDMVIGNATPADFEQMTQCCERAEAATSVEEFEVWDGLFHEVIARSAHNGFVARLFKLMNQK